MVVGDQFFPMVSVSPSRNKILTARMLRTDTSPSVRRSASVMAPLTSSTSRFSRGADGHAGDYGGGAARGDGRSVAGELATPSARSGTRKRARRRRPGQGAASSGRASRRRGGAGGG